jgi:hypothetical protein
VTDRRPEGRSHLCRAGYFAAFHRQLWFLEECIGEASPGEVSRRTRVREAIVGLGREADIEVLGTAITVRVPL